MFDFDIFCFMTSENLIANTKKAADMSAYINYKKKASLRTRAESFGETETEDTSALSTMRKNQTDERGQAANKAAHAIMNSITSTGNNVYSNTKLSGGAGAFLATSSRQLEKPIVYNNCQNFQHVLSPF